MLAVLDEPVRSDDEMVLLLLLLELEYEALSAGDPSAIMSVLHWPFRLRVYYEEHSSLLGCTKPSSQLSFIILVCVVGAVLLL